MQQQTKVSIKKGVFWSAIERFATQLIQFTVAVVLARLLTPDDFGVVAIVLVFTTIFQTINESGFNMALIHKLNRSDVDYGTALITNIFIGIFGYCLLFIFAPVISLFYDKPELTNVMRWLSMTLIINSFGIVQNAIFTIRVDFKTQAKASVSAAVLSGAVGIIVALYYHSIYAIVIQSILYSFINVLLLWVLGRWYPKRFFSLCSFKELFSYAYKLILARLINVIFDDIYSLAIGKLYSPSLLAYYNRANSFRQILSKNILNIIQRVSNPVLCKHQNNYVELGNILLKFIVSSSLIVYPLLTILMMLSKEIVLVVLGDKWITTSEMLYFVCPIGFFYLISTFNRNVFNATGKTNWALKNEIVKKVIFVVVFLFTMHYDIRILLGGLILDSIFEMFYDMRYTTKQIGLRIRTQFKSIFPVLLGSLLLALTILFIKLIFENDWVRIIMGSMIGGSVYLLYSYAYNVGDCRNHIKTIFAKS